MYIFFIILIPLGQAIRWLHAVTRLHVGLHPELELMAICMVNKPTDSCVFRCGRFSNTYMSFNTITVTNKCDCMPQ